MLSVGMWVDCCRFWSVVYGRVLIYGSRISLSGELVPEFHHFKKFQVFGFLNPSGLVPAKVVTCNESGRKK